MEMRIPGGLARFAAVGLLYAGAAFLLSSEGSPFTSRDKAAYIDPKLIDFVRPGLTTKVVGASIASDGTIKAQIKITDPKGLALDREGVSTPGAVSISLIAAHIPANVATYVSYTTRTATSTITKATAIQAGTDSGGTWAKLGDGLYEYTFKTKATNFVSSETHSIGVYSSRNLSEFNLGTQYSDDVYTWVPGGGQVVKVRDVIRTATCNKCHDPLSAHGGARQKVELCVLCHTPQTVDPDTGNTVDFTVMVHKIHMGEKLPSVESGHPYQIIGFGNSVIDFSGVRFPVTQLEGNGVAKCDTCHDPNSGAKQADAWLKPSRAACGSCHDNVNFATGENHANLPQISDNQCGTCHQVQGELEFDISIKGAHTFPEFSATRPGINVKVLNLTGGRGEKPTVTYKVTDDSGAAIAMKDLQTTPNRLGLVLAGPAVEYGSVSFGSDVTTPGYVSEDPTRTAVCGSDGTCTYKFTHAIPADAKGTYSVGIEGRRGLTLLAGTKQERSTEYGAVNDVYYFSVDGSKVAPRRQVVSIDSCNSCHNFLNTHGTNRNRIEQCVLCHNPANTDAARRPAAAKPDQTVSFAYMVHRIHAGEKATPNREYTVYGFGNVPYDFTEVRFPGDLRNCAKCHINNSQQIDGKEDVLSAVKAPRSLLDPMPGITAACLGCHTSTAAASHALANTTKLGESCSACHGQGADFSIDKEHAR